MNLNKCETSGNQNRLVEVDFVAVTYRFWWEKKDIGQTQNNKWTSKIESKKKHSQKPQTHYILWQRMECWSREIHFLFVNQSILIPRNRLHDVQPKNVRQFAVSKFRIFRVHELSLGLFILSHSWLYLNFNFNSAHFKIFHYVARSSMHTLHTPAILLEDLKMCCECNTQVETSFSFFSHNYNTIWFAVLLFYWAR